MPSSNSPSSFQPAAIQWRNRRIRKAKPKVNLPIAPTEDMPTSSSTIRPRTPPRSNHTLVIRSGGAVRIEPRLSTTFAYAEPEPKPPVPLLEQPQVQTGFFNRAISLFSAYAQREPSIAPEMAHEDQVVDEVTEHMLTVEPQGIKLTPRKKRKVSL